MQDQLYEVYETDADLYMDAENIKFQSYHKDMAETKAALLIRESNYEKDFLVYNRKTQNLEMVLLSNRSKANRGECQQ